MYNQDVQQEAPYQPRAARGLAIETGGQLEKRATIMDMALRNSQALDELRNMVFELGDKLEPIRDRMPVDEESKLATQPDPTKLSNIMDIERSKIREIHNYVNMLLREVNL